MRGRVSEGARGRMDIQNSEILKYMELIKTHKDLKVYQLSFEAGMKVFHIKKIKEGKIIILTKEEGLKSK